MPRRNSSSSESASSFAEGGPRPFRILVADCEGDLCRLLEQATLSRAVAVRHAPSVAQARQHLAQGPADLVLIDPRLSGGSGLELAQDIGRQFPHTQTIVVADQPTLEHALEAIRAGVSDFIVKPVELQELNARVKAAFTRHCRDRRKLQRLQRLRRVCRKLNQAHSEVTQQVDILCNDLVTAYQELASQMQQVSHGSDFAGRIRNELDLERVLRRTLEYLLEKAGPVNAAVFLPASLDEYTLGGYINLDCGPDGPTLILEHLGDTLAPRVGLGDEVIHLTTPAAVAEWVGEDLPFLAAAHLLAFPCRHRDEPLAVAVLFRSPAEPFHPDLLQACRAIGPLLGDHLARVIRIHHRHVGGPKG